MLDFVCGLYDANNRTGQSAAQRKSTRPRNGRDADRQKLSGLEAAVKFRLGEKRAGQLQDFIGLLQFFDLALQVFDPLHLGGGHACTAPRIDLITLYPFQ